MIFCVVFVVLINFAAFYFIIRKERTMRRAIEAEISEINNKFKSRKLNINLRMKKGR